MNFRRLKYTVALAIQRGGYSRATYIRKKKLFHHMGEGVMYQPRKLPLYPELISIHNNVSIASRVAFLTHDVIHAVVNNIPDLMNLKVHERVGCIEIMDNTFIGAGATILYNVRIGQNVIVAAGSIVTKDLESNGVYAGVPAKYICSFDEFLNKWIASDTYPNHLAPSHQEVGTELVEYLWKQFDERRIDED